MEPIAVVLFARAKSEDDLVKGRCSQDIRRGTTQSSKSLAKEVGGLRQARQVSKSEQGDQDLESGVRLTAKRESQSGQH